jgi:ornithine--oxo-acid transaminase
MLIQKAEQAGEQLLRGFAAMIPRYGFLREAQGKGLVMGLEFGVPQSFSLKASWNALEASRKGLFCQLITIPLFKDHKILFQVAGHASHTIKLLPPLVIFAADCEWILNAFESVIADSHRVPGAIWSLGESLIGQAMRTSA